MDVSGFAPTGSTVTVTAQGTGQTVDRQGDYYHSAASVDNSAHSVNASITVTSTAPSSSLTRQIFLAKATLGTNEKWTYDADGNLTQDDQWTYTWNAENRLIAMETRADLITAGIFAAADARHLDFTYDYLGRRAEKIVRGGWNGSSFATVLSDTRFIYHGWNLVGEFAAGSSTLTRSYTWGLDLSGTLAGDGGTGGLLMTQDGSIQYVYAYDGNGNVSAVMNRSGGTTVAEYEYGSFGEPLRASNTYAQTNPFRFSTQYYDTETGFFYYGHRYYNPQTGRFLVRDGTEEKGGLNLYGFCGNNGINAWDLLGNGPRGFTDSSGAWHDYDPNKAWSDTNYFFDPGMAMAWHPAMGQMANYGSGSDVGAILAFDQNYNENTWVESYDFGEGYNAVADNMGIGTLTVAGQNVTASTAIAVSNIRQSAALNGQTVSEADALAVVQSDANASKTNTDKPASSSDGNTAGGSGTSNGNTASPASGNKAAASTGTSATTDGKVATTGPFDFKLGDVQVGLTPSNGSTLVTSAVGVDTSKRGLVSDIVNFNVSVSNAQMLVSNALSDIHISNTLNTGTAAYTNAFGVFSIDRGMTVENNLLSIQAALNQPVTMGYITKQDPLYSSTVFAYVTIGVNGLINTGPSYWNAPDLGTDSRAGTVVHETSHLVAGTQDYAYGSNALSLAKTNPDLAIQNADNYEYYAEYHNP